MKVCPECGYNNEDTRDYCQECGINLNTSLTKPNNINPIAIPALYKVDKPTGNLRISKTKVISWITFSLTSLFIIFVGLFAPGTALWAFILVAFLFGALFGLIMYLIGYVIAGLLEKIGF